MKLLQPFLLLASLGLAAPLPAAVKHLEKRATAGEARAQVALGVAYRDGAKVARDPGKAVQWFRAAVDQGFAEANDHLGWMYLNGLGVARDYAEARRLFAEGGRHHVPRALYNLGECEAIGLGAPTNDLAKAWDLFLRAAELDCASAYGRLATLSLLTSPPAQPPARLASEMERLRGSGHALAARVLGFQRYLGAGAPADRERAEALWKEADAKLPVPAPLISMTEWAALRDRAAQPGAFVFLHLPSLAQGHNLCAATAAAGALSGLGLEVDPLDIKRRCPHSPFGEGTAWDQLSDAIRASGVQVELATFGLDEAGGEAGWQRVRAELDAGRPVIVDIRDPGEPGADRAAHSVVVMGYDAAKGLVYVQNSACDLPGVEAFTQAVFRARWDSRWYMPSAPAQCRPALFLRRKLGS